MRSLVYVAASLVAVVIASLAGLSAAEAQNRRPLRVIVEKRSFLDAGKVVPTGSYNRHLEVANFAGFSPISNINGLYGGNNLPGYIGAGVNPFANSFYTPTFR